ncbi:hypothetical protein AB6A40_008296 [Gnathostoma spinigerum]|uniref:Transthyretin-like family protein n=1 Tax=Gnathostoma spinigerum TaxID=75299 RepID=A0ABD6EY17_9BILA
MRFSRYYSLTLLTSLLCINDAAIRQAVYVRGKLLCGSSPASRVRVKIFDEDAGVDPDDKIAEGLSNNKGEFDLGGSIAELTTVDPLVKIYHDCDDTTKPGQRKLVFRLPKHYVVGADHTKKYFDFGILNLETIFPGEQRSFIR